MNLGRRLAPVIAFLLFIVFVGTLGYLILEGLTEVLGCTLHFALFRGSGLERLGLQVLLDLEWVLAVGQAIASFRARHEGLVVLAPVALGMLGALFIHKFEVRLELLGPKIPIGCIEVLVLFAL